MSSDETWMKQMGYDQSVEFMETLLKMFLGSAESLIVNDTSIFDDYSKYVSARFDPVQKAKQRDEQFPIDCQKAYAMGAGFKQKINSR
jgi:hypothetical protein